MPEISYSYISQSIQGIHKSENQDNFLTIENDRYYLFAIFDGVGSASNSRMATVLAKDFIQAHHATYIGGSVRLDQLMYDCNRHLVGSMIVEAFTTYCLVFMPKDRPGEVIFSSLGDSRIYVISNRFIEQVTTDDKSPDLNVLTRCLGMPRLSRDDFSQDSLQIDRENLLLCTDGFYYFLEINRLTFFDIFQKKNLKSIREILGPILSGKNRDDATYILIR